MNCHHFMTYMIPATARVKKNRLWVKNIKFLTERGVAVGGGERFEYIVNLFFISLNTT